MLLNDYSASRSFTPRFMCSHDGVYSETHARNWFFNKLTMQNWFEIFFWFFCFFLYKKIYFLVFLYKKFFGLKIFLLPSPDPQAELLWRTGTPWITFRLTAFSQLFMNIRFRVIWSFVIIFSPSSWVRHAQIVRKIQMCDLNSKNPKQMRAKHVTRRFCSRQVTAKRYFRQLRTNGSSIQDWNSEKAFK